MGLFNKMTFWDALQLLDCDYLSPHLKKKIIKAESNFTEEEKTACYIMYSLHKGDCGLALSFINRAEHGEELIPEIMMALFTHVAVRTFRAAYEKEPSNPDYIAFFAFAYEIGFYDCEKDHAKAVEFADLLRFTDADGALVKYALKKIFPEETHNGSTADDNVRKNATANTEPTSTAVPTSAKDPSDESAPQAEFKRIEYDGGDVFEGYFLNGKENGHGTYTWSDGSFYDGEWKDGKKDGNGKQSHPDGSCYDGGWKDDKMDGFGVLVYSNQSRYEGHWSEGNENGHGMLTFANGNSYDGEWKDGNENGHGIKKYINVGVYDGEWKDGDENGHGIMKYINGDVYDGEWKDGYENGHGTMTYANGDRYDGEWKDGHENGHGMLTFANGNSYDGDWVNGEMNGNGIYTYANGEKYKVTCKEDEIISKEPFETPKTSSTVIRSNQKAKTEYKQIRYDGGDVYEGETQNGKRHGKGKYTWADGDTYEGDWKDDKRCGRGKLVEYGKSPSGETYMKYSYDGEWLDSKEHGHGICVEGDFGWEKMDKVFEGEWVDGKRQGRFVWYYTNSKGGRYINFYEDGKLVETCIPYDERIKTVEDIRRAKGKTSGASENLNHMNMSKIPSWDSVKSGDYSDKVKKETEARRQYIRETVRRLRNPGEALSRAERNIENACMLLEPFITEAENLFLKGEEEKALEIIEEMLDINIVPDDEWYYNSDTKYFSQFLSGALYSLASQIDFDTPDHDRFIVPAANIACYLWKKYGDYSLFGSVAFLWSATEKDHCGSFLWLNRMRDNGDYTVVSKFNESSEYYFGHDLDRYTMGSDCELF